MDETTDSAELTSLYRTYHRAITGYLTMLCRDAETAEDLTQETFIRIQRSFASFDPSKGSFLGYAKTIAKNLYIRDLQKRERHRTDYDSERIEQRVDERQGIEDFFADESIKKMVHHAIECLTEPERSIIYFKYRDHLTLDEMASRLNISRRTVSRRFLKGLEILQKALKEKGLEGGNG